MKTTSQQRWYTSLAGKKLEVKRPVKNLTIQYCISSKFDDLNLANNIDTIS